MHMIIGRPLTGGTLLRLRRFLASLGLDYDDGVEMSCCACDEYGEIIATASRQGPVLKCCLLYTSPSPRDISGSRMPSSA